MIIKINKKHLAEKLLDKALMSLYKLEDLNEYRNNTIGKAINELQKIKFKEVTQ